MVDTTQSAAPEPRDAEWGEYHFHVADPDGHELGFAKLLVRQGIDPLTGKLRFG